MQTSILLVLSALFVGSTNAVESSVRGAFERELRQDVCLKACDNYFSQGGVSQTCPAYCVIVEGLSPEEAAQSQCAKDCVNFDFFGTGAKAGAVYGFCNQIKEDCCDGDIFKSSCKIFP